MNLASDRLVSVQNPDGGWGAYAGQPSRTETTALAAVGLHAYPEDSARVSAERAMSWLADRQAPDGSWSVAEGLPGGSWQTSLAALAAARSRPESDMAFRAGTWLLAQEGRRPGWWTRLLLRLSGRQDEVALDLELVGWPWHDGTFSWVEPTSYALLAVKAMRGRLPRARVDERVDLGERMLFDRVCEGGGWNYGNSTVLGEDLWPYPDTTGAALWALYDRPEAPAVQQAFVALDVMLETVDSLLAVSIGVVCARAHGRPVDRLAPRVAERIGGARQFVENRALALATLALAPAFDWSR